MCHNLPHRQEAWRLGGLGEVNLPENICPAARFASLELAGRSYTPIQELLRLQAIFVLVGFPASSGTPD